MSYEIAEVAESYHRSYQGRNGTTYVFKVTTTEGAVAEVGKLKGTPQVGDVYKTLREPSANAPEGALPTLSEKDTESSPPPQNGNGGHTFAGSDGGGNYNRQTNPEDAKRMGRCHAQEMAWIAIAEMRQQGWLPDDINSATTLLTYHDRLVERHEGKVRE